MGVNKNAPNLGNRVDIYDKSGKRLARLGDIFAGEKPGQFIAPHGSRIDSRGDIYVGEVSWTIMGQRLHAAARIAQLAEIEEDELRKSPFSHQGTRPHEVARFGFGVLAAKNAM